ncbi:MAG: hypothetical protein QXQ61_04400 [Candidatus Bathyarchaeia archaeon]
MIRKNISSLASLIIFLCLIHACFAAEQEEANQAITKAENDLALAYTAVAEANSAGADVSQLLAKLEFAGALLAEAQNAYRRGDFGKAFLLATNCSDAVNNVVQEATALKTETEENKKQQLLFTAGVSSAFLSILFVSSLFGWRLLKRLYLERVLEMKPEVEADAK